MGRNFVEACKHFEMKAFAFVVAVDFAQNFHLLLRILFQNHWTSLAYFYLVQKMLVLEI